MDNRAPIIFFLIAVYFFSGCGNSSDFATVKEHGLSFGGIRTKKDGIIKVRVSFDKYIPQLDAQLFVKKMNYNVDSCFYLLGENGKIYPEFITPVATGIDKTFDYMLGFAESEVANKLVYFDKYQSEKKIEIIFN